MSIKYKNVVDNTNIRNVRRKTNNYLKNATKTVFKLEPERATDDNDDKSCYNY